MAIEKFSGLINYVTETPFECGYELIVLFAATKLKAAEGRFEKERVMESFIEFYELRENNHLSLETGCNPLQGGDRDKIMMVINRKPVSALLKVGILKTFERFKPEIFQMLFDNEEAILKVIKARIVRYFIDEIGDSKSMIQNILKIWEKGINAQIKAEALQKVSGSIEKINLEFFLKYLFQSYSASAFQKFLESFQIEEGEFDAFFESNLAFFAKFVKKQEEGAAAAPGTPGKEKEEEPAEEAAHLKDLRSFFQEMRDEAEAEEEDKKKKKTKKKKKK